MKIVVFARAVVASLLIVAASTCAVRAEREAAPIVLASDRGATIGRVSIETYGTANAKLAMRYLSLHAGDVLSQAAVTQDYTNLETLAGLRTRLEVLREAGSSEVTLHWIVLGKVFATTDHPFYGDPPLSIPIEGFGTVLTSPALDKSGATLSMFTQLALRAQLARIVYTKPLFVNAKLGNEGDLVVDTVGARGDFRATEPITQDVYSWFSGYEALFLFRSTSGNQLEAGVESTRATSAKPTYLNAPSVLDTYVHPGRSTTLEAGVSRRCPIAPTEWFPPHCYFQYRVEAFDSVGGFGANTEYRSLFVDVAQYNRVGSSTLVVHGSVSRTGGVLPTSNLLCAYTFGYAKASCGTDANLVQGEFRIADARPGPFKVILFTETASSRIRGGHQDFAPSTFQWRADSGVGLQYRGFRFNVAYGNQGGRITYEVLGQLF